LKEQEVLVMICVCGIMLILNPVPCQQLEKVLFYGNSIIK